MRALGIGGSAIGASAFKRFTGLIQLQIAVPDRDRFFPLDRFAYVRIEEIPGIATGRADEILFPEGYDRDEKQAETIANKIDLIAPKMTAPTAGDRLIVFQQFAERQYIKK
ncbi:hypothetical protein SDC9_66158 [bioreactor metagenome]|uniref:Uncharacterized protein n=1 Tax=bioreactor metagenome TaxID=1076179 RepID=A0A644XU51_9ZZZZ